jgi:hypothetical protein
MLRVACFACAKCFMITTLLTCKGTLIFFASTSDHLTIQKVSGTLGKTGELVEIVNLAVRAVSS